MKGKNASRIGTYWKFNGSLNARLSYQWLAFTLSATGQLMPFDDVVPNCEIMRVGGYSTVRGYSEGCAWGKSGYTAKAEIHFMYTENAGSLYVFVDHAGVFPYPDIDDHFLLSCGVGTGFQIGNFFSMNIGLGIKAIEIYQDKGSASERGYFSVTVSI